MKRENEGKEETKMWKRDCEGNEEYLETFLPSLTELSNGTVELVHFSALRTYASSVH